MFHCKIVVRKGWWRRRGRQMDIFVISTLKGVIINRKRASLISIQGPEDRKPICFPAGQPLSLKNGVCLKAAL